MSLRVESRTRPPPRRFMQTTLASAARVRGQYTRSLLVTNAESLPLVDYRPGDWITAPTVQHGEKVRIQQVTVSLDSNGLKASITLNDKVYDSQVRAAKKIAGITGGATLAGSEGGRPAPEKDHRTPKAPTGLVVQTDAYISSRGTALGLATLQWAAVSQATDDTAIDISGYRVEYRKNLAGAPWVSGGVTDAQRLTLGIGGLECGQRYEFRVRAVPTYSDRLGDWSNVVVALVASDVTPPSIPSSRYSPRNWVWWTCSGTAGTMPAAAWSWTSTTWRSAFPIRTGGGNTGIAWRVTGTASSPASSIAPTGSRSGAWTIRATSRIGAWARRSRSPARSPRTIWTGSTRTSPPTRRLCGITPRS